MNDVMWGEEMRGKIEPCQDDGGARYPIR